MASRKSDGYGGFQNVCIQAGIEDEFVVEHFLLRTSQPGDFIKSQWCRGGSWAYVSYRVVIALGFLIWFPWDYWYNMVNFNEGAASMWFLYATNWTLLGVLLASVMHAVLTLFYTLTQKELTELTWAVKLYWIIQIICHNGSIVICVCFWAAIMVLPHGEMFSSLPSRMKHSLTCTYVLLDTFISAYPIRIFHIIYPMLAMLTYVAFNGIYFRAGGEGPEHHPYVYYQLQWTHVRESVITILMTQLMAIVAQMVLYTVYCARKVIYNCCNKCTQTEETMPILESRETRLDE